MILNRLIYAIGVMASAYILSRLAHSLAESLSESRRFPFIVKILTAIYYFSSLASLFFGLFMYYQQEHTENLQKRIDELTLSNQNLKAKIDTLEDNNKQLSDQLYEEQFRTEERSLESGRMQGYVNGYSIGFEDCMDMLELDEAHKLAMLPTARKSGIHRIKTRPSIFDTQKAVNIDGILR
jgi:cell division protein FtsB